MQRNTGYFPTESLEPSGNRLFSRSALNEGYLFRGSLRKSPKNQSSFAVGGPGASERGVKKNHDLIRNLKS